MDNKNIRTDLNIKVIGWMIKHMVMESYSELMDHIIKAFLNMEIQIREKLLIKINQFMKDIFKNI